MKDEDKSREELLVEIAHLRNRINQIEFPDLMRNVMDSLRAETRVHLAEDKYGLAFHGNPDPITITTIEEGRYVEVNEAFLNALGYKRQEVLGRTMSDLNIWASPEERESMWQWHQGRNRSNGEFSLRTKNGQIITLHYYAERIILAGKPHILTVTRDITDFKRAEESLRLSNHRFYRAFNFNPDPTSISTIKDGRYVEVNDAWVELTGYKKHEAIGRKALEFGIWLDYEREALIQQIQEKGSILSRETMFRNKTGSIKVCLLSAVIIEWDGEECLYCINKDISDRKQMEEALRLSEEKFSKAFNACPVGMAITTLKDDKFIAVNESYERLFGHKQEEVQGKTSTEIGFWVYPADSINIRRKIMSKESVRDLEIQFRKMNGETGIGLFSAEGIEIDGKACVLNVISDISERKRS